MVEIPGYQTAPLMRIPHKRRPPHAFHLAAAAIGPQPSPYYSRDCNAVGNRSPSIHTFTGVDITVVDG
jgi:hypothetical protein